MEPQGRGNVPARHTPERNKRLGLRKTTLESRGHVQTSWAECPRQKKFRHRAEGEIFLLTFPFIGRRNWMSRTQLAFNSGDLAFQEITTSRPNRNSATRVVSLDAVWPVTATSFGPQMDPNERRRNWMSRTQLAFNSGDLAFQEI